MRWTSMVLASLLGVSFTWHLGADDAPRTCEDDLVEAEAAYRSGRIESVEALLTSCVEGKPRRDQRVRAHELLAKTLLALDQSARARQSVESLLAQDASFTPTREDPLPFARLVASVRNARDVVTVASVSKTDEPLAEAPATVVVVTAEQIERRGYTDLEQIFHDLPGFDISRGNGTVYSNLYQRGFRSNANERMLFLVDGVEQNHLMSNTAYISRQYPLSNIQRIEVVYGPASTIYGANAYTGVVSVSTKDPDDLVEPDATFGFTGQVVRGPYGTRLVDASVAGSHPGFAWSLTGRAFRSDEPDLSGFDDWDYDPRFVDTVDYDAVFRVDDPVGGLICDAARSPLCRTILDADGTVVGAELSDSGRRLVAERDRAQLMQGAFDDFTDDWSIFGKLRVGNLRLGGQIWQLREGTNPWFADRSRRGRNVWTPRQMAFSADYSRALGSRWSFAFTSRYKRHDLGSGAHQSTYSLLANLDPLASFINLGVLTSNPDLLLESRDTRRRLDEVSSQFRNEVTFVYRSGGKLDVVSGLEVRNSSIQDNFIVSDLSSTSPADPAGDGLVTGSKIEEIDLGAYAQASYRPRADWKLVAGVRVDRHRFENIDREATEGFGNLDPETSVNPRLAIVYTPGDFVFKAIYAEAFKRPSIFERFSVSDVRQPTSLENEEVENLELSGFWRIDERTTVEVAVYEADYANVVGLVQGVLVGNRPQERFVNLGPQEIRGIQASAAWQRERVGLSASYSYTDPKSKQPVDRFGRPGVGDAVRVADIARHRWTLGATFERDDVELHLSARYVGARRSGEGTTVLVNPFRRIESYVTADAAITYRGLGSGFLIQGVVRNLFDEDYFHPGVQSADGVAFASRLPQPRRSLWLSLKVSR